MRTVGMPLYGGGRVVPHRVEGAEKLLDQNLEAWQRIWTGDEGCLKDIYARKSDPRSGRPRIAPLNLVWEESPNGTALLFLGP